MAKKKAEAEVKEEVLEEAKVEKAEVKEEVDYYDELVPIFIPLEDNDSGELTVGFNGTIYKIKKGQEVMVPRKLAIIIRNSNAQAVAMRQYSESVKEQELNA